MHFGDAEIRCDADRGCQGLVDSEYRVSTLETATVIHSMASKQGYVVLSLTMANQLCITTA